MVSSVLCVGLGLSPSWADDIICTSVDGVAGNRLRNEYDVIVIGAGTGGVAAALQAARLGASVLLVEPTDWIGGQLAAAGVTSLDEGYPPRERLRERGIYGEFWHRAVAYYRALGKSTDTCAVSEDHFAVEPHVAQRLLYDMIRDTREMPLPEGKPVVLDLLLRGEVTAVARDGQTVRGVTVENVAEDGSVREENVGSQIVIDATEYGDVIPLTGALYRVGVWLSDREHPPTQMVPPAQPITWTASIKQYPKGLPEELKITEPPREYNEKLISRSLSPKGTSTSKFPWRWERFLKYRGMPDSSSPLSAHNGSGLTLTRSHINFHPNDQPFSVLDVEDRDKRRQAEYRARLRTLGVLYYIQNVMNIDDWSVANDVGYDSPYNREKTGQLIQEFPDLEPYREILYHFPVIAYARESRRIVGTYTLSAKEIRRTPPFKPVRFETALAIGDYPVDVHGEAANRNLQVELDLDEEIDLPERWIQWGYGPFQIPFGSFIPRDVDGLLPAEKNLSQSRIASGATRLQPVTMLTGQASGAIAGVACRMSLQPREVPPLLVQKALLDAGSTLALDYYTDVVHGTELWKAVQLASLYELIDFTEWDFNENKRVTRKELDQVSERLQNVQIERVNSKDLKSHAFTLQAETRQELVREVARLLLLTTIDTSAHNSAQTLSGAARK
ncbi:FAD-dependent oxidoreductase [Bythopirellula polymerisocia]|uniref:Putative FAD-binding dehydrogenase n=1 Tax=Bythopirellula polymerisocia TaxID=2528003 RepID=A0A5C6CCH5_9BACT|nr:FAD-dependent oxidoreductase [Bythopirellula polymerisocia]TWU21802.1 putative FAD-binding dehydrogenase [Bythopirellula polymerisocia]